VSCATSVDFSSRDNFRFENIVEYRENTSIVDTYEMVCDREFQFFITTSTPFSCDVDKNDQIIGTFGKLTFL
jgi:hypothetical protein